MKQLPLESSLVFASTTVQFSKTQVQQILFAFTQQIPLNIFPVVLCIDMLWQ